VAQDPTPPESQRAVPSAKVLGKCKASGDIEPALVKKRVRLVQDEVATPPEEQKDASQGR
jgi:hypothetical protein